jgi:hypothetical protein
MGGLNDSPFIFNLNCEVVGKFLTVGLRSFLRTVHVQKNEKQEIPHCRNSSKIQSKIAETGKFDKSKTHTLTVHFPGSVSYD